MPVIDSKYVEIEIQEQTMPGAAKHYCIMVKFEPTEHKSLQIQSIILSDFEPLIKWTRDNGKSVTKIGEEKIKSLPEQDVDRTSAEGKASSVQFIHFQFTNEQVKKFKDLSNEIIIGIEHKMYSHTVKLTENNVKALLPDFS